MPTIRMKTDSATPPRTAGKLYVVDGAEGWALVSAGDAAWEYVPESQVAALTVSDREEREEREETSEEPERVPTRPARK